MNHAIDWLPEKNRCECGGKLILDFHKAYTCDVCKYYEVNGKVITDCSGNLLREYAVEDAIFFKGMYYKLSRLEANIGDLVFLEKPIEGRQIYTVKDFGGYETRSVVVGKGIDAMDYDEYYVLIPISKKVNI